MKIRRAFSGMLFGLGCAISFIGVMAIALPQVENEQLQLVLASFDDPSRFAIANLISAVMRFAMEQSWQFLGTGMLFLIVGSILFCRFSRPVQKPSPLNNPYQRPESAPIPEPAPEPNPFAVAGHSQQEAYSFAPQLSIQEKPVISIVTQHKPLLDENPIDESQPCLPPSFAAESRAIESESGDASPSGSRVILRSVPPMETPIPTAVQPEPPAPPAAPIDPPPAEPLMRTPRIRSTMGRHKQW